MAEYPQQTIRNPWEIFGSALREGGQIVGDYADSQTRMRQALQEMADRRAEAIFARQKWEEQAKRDQERAAREQAEYDRKLEAEKLANDRAKALGAQIRTSGATMAPGNADSARDSEKRTLYGQAVEDRLVGAEKALGEVFDDGLGRYGLTLEEELALRAKYRPPAAPTVRAGIDMEAAARKVDLLKNYLGELDRVAAEIASAPYKKTIVLRDALGGPSETITIENEPQKAAHIQRIRDQKIKVRQELINAQAISGKDGGAGQAADPEVEELKRQSRELQRQAEETLKRLQGGY